MSRPSDALWNAYVAASASPSRKEALEALQRFLGSIRCADDQQRHSRAAAIGREHLDTLAPARRSAGELRQPLLARFLAPSYAELHQAGHPDAARWLGITLLLLAQKGVADEQLGSPIEALRQTAYAAEDRAARRWMIEILSAGLRYVFHELPAGVLDDDPVTLLEDIAELETLTADREDADLWRQRAAFWRFHTNGWLEYLAARPHYANYAAYLEQNPPPTDPDDL